VSTLHQALNDLIVGAVALLCACLAVRLHFVQSIGDLLAFGCGVISGFGLVAYGILGLGDYWVARRAR
jgi:hypothetical protein